MKRTLLTTLRAIIGITLAVLLIQLTLKGADTNLQRLWDEQIKAAAIPLLFWALVLYGIVLAVGSLRWQILLHAQRIDIGYFNTLRLTLIGFFFNLAVPGAVGGDVVKIGYTMRHAPEQKTAAFFSIVTDRIMGILGLFIVAGFAVLLNLRTILKLGETSPFLQAGAILVGLGSFAGVAGFLVLEYHGLLLKHRKLQPLWTFCNRRLPKFITGIAGRLMTALDMYQKSKASLAKALLLAIAVHCLLALSMFTVGKALAENTLSVGEYFVTTQVANAVAAVPVTPGGVGLRDKGAQELFAALGMPKEKSGAIPVTMTLIILAWALIGGGVFSVAPVSPRRSIQTDETANK
ncbi:MAG: lysylphosphatidylglycerol synthase transmembrane domain-containing protein [Lentisphaeria bacterium]